MPSDVTEGNTRYFVSSEEASIVSSRCVVGSGLELE